MINNHREGEESMKRKIVLPVAVVLGLMTTGHLSVDANTKEVFNKRRFICGCSKVNTII